MAKEVEQSESTGWVESSRQYLVDVRGEFRKVTWPQQREAAQGTLGVVVIVAVITLVLGLVDLVLAEVVKWVLP